MKKSKFLKSSKDMLSRSFNPSKCKTSLRLAASRLKLLRNKKEAQVKQMRREISLLLESGQDQTARIRVEHVIREEKMMAAFDLIEIYCELIVARLPIIESQKICPIDLKEAITSVVFASPRCGDVPELADAKKHFADKYGKDFITAAIELRPDCGVSRMLVEKLSAGAPDLQTKIKILSAIAEEHNVKWDAKPLEQNSVAASDLLTGPSTFVKESERLVEPPRFQGPTKLPETNQVDHRASLGSERIISPQVSGVSTAFQHETRPQSFGGEREQVYHRDSNSIPRDRQRWKMEFTDATSAAQAAAESAEMASMAARAAAELSSRDMISRQHSAGSHNSDDHSLRDGTPDMYMRSKFGSEQVSKESTNRSFSEHGWLQNEQTDRGELNNTGGRYEAGRDGRRDYSHSSSLKSKASIDDESMDRYSQKNSFKEVPRGEKSMQRQSFKYQAENRQEKSENVREETVRKQESFTSTHSHSSISNNVNIFSNPEDQNFEYEEASQKSSRESAVVFDRSDSDTENDGFDIRPTYDEPQQGFQLPLSSHKSHERLSPNTDPWSPKSSTSKNVKSSASVLSTRNSPSFDFPERSVDDSLSVTFDESDRPTSESEEDMKTSRDNRNSRDFISEQKKQSFGSPHKGTPQFDQTQLSLSSDYESEETDSERNQGKKFDADPPPKFNLRKPSDDPPPKFNLRKPSADQPALVRKHNQTELNDIGNSSPEREEGLNFGKLTGGFRHKGYNYPSFGKNQFNVSPSKNESKVTTAGESPRIKTVLGSKNTKSDLQSTSDIDSSEEEQEDVSMQKSYKHQLYNRSGGKDLKTKPGFTASNSLFGSVHSDSDDDLPKEPLSIRTSRLQSGISRRTKAAPSDYEKEKLPKLQLRSEAVDVDDGMDRKGTTSTSSETPRRYEIKRNSSKFENYEQHASMKAPENSNSGGATSARIQKSKVELRSEAHDSHVHVRKEQKPTKSYSVESQQQFQSSKGNSSQLRSSDLPSSSNVATTKPATSTSRGYLHQHTSEKANYPITRESKVSTKSSAIEEASMPQRKSEPSTRQENLIKAETPSKTSSNESSSNQKASHVHPKLPDYDSFVQFFQKNRS